jgi:hypothetical protein
MTLTMNYRPHKITLYSERSYSCVKIDLVIAEKVNPKVGQSIQSVDTEGGKQDFIITSQDWSENKLDFEYSGCVQPLKTQVP